MGSIFIIKCLVGMEENRFSFLELLRPQNHQTSTILYHYYALSVNSLAQLIIRNKWLFTKCSEWIGTYFISLSNSKYSFPFLLCFACVELIFIHSMTFQFIHFVKYFSFTKKRRKQRKIEKLRCTLLFTSSDNSSTPCSKRLDILDTF